MKELKIEIDQNKIILKENGIEVEELILTPTTKIIHQNRKGEKICMSRDDFSHGIGVGTTQDADIKYERSGNNLTIELKGRKVLKITEED